MVPSIHTVQREESQPDVINHVTSKMNVISKPSVLARHTFLCIVVYISTRKISINHTFCNTYFFFNFCDQQGQVVKKKGIKN